MNKFLVIGLGSMGKRRIRCLLALGYRNDEIIGMDTREDRRQEVNTKYEIDIVDDIKKINFSEIKAVIVSLPPDKHAVGAKIAIDNRKPVFIEASVIIDDVLDIQKYNSGDVFIAPSCTMTYHPIIKDIKAIIKSKKYGKVCNFSYHSGQYLPDWHPWENVKDFYAGKRITGGAREIVAFEFTWIVDLLGFPNEVKGHFRKTMDFGCDIEDSYTSSIIFNDIIGTMIVDVVSRYATRNLIINFEKAHLQWRWDKKTIELYEAETDRWIYFDQPNFKSAGGYNENIGEKMYIEELDTFIKGISDRRLYPNTIEKDIKILEILKSIEESDGGFNR